MHLIRHAVPPSGTKRQAPCHRSVRQGRGEQNRRRIAEAELRESSDKAFEAYGEPLENVTAFRYLVWVLTAGYDDWLTVVGNIGKAI